MLSIRYSIDHFFAYLKKHSFLQIQIANNRVPIYRSLYELERYWAAHAQALRLYGLRRLVEARVCPWQLSPASSLVSENPKPKQTERGKVVRTIDELINKALTRRNFMVGAGSAAALTAVGCSHNFQPQTTPTNPTSTLTDADYLNFALNLEYLEASYYLIAATGSGLSAADAGSGAGAVTGGAQVPFTSMLQQEYAYEIAQDELNHVRFLRSALGSSAVPAPAIDLVNSFNGAAMAAGIGPTFDPFASFDAFLVGAFVFEDVGVTAYHGAAPLLTSTAYLGAAAGIMAVEAYHAAEVRTLVLEAGSAYVGYANQISALRAKLGGGNETALSATSIVACDPTNAIAYARTPYEVLNIVYASPDGNVTSGGFFPNGLNGNITSTLG
jgi:hypothetical protein